MKDHSDAHLDRVSVALLFYLLIISCSFFIVRPTLLFLLCYVFAIAGAIEFAVSLMILAQKQSRLPQDLVFPIIAWGYMLANLLCSVIFIILEQKISIEIRFIWPFLVHLILISFFTWRVLALHAGKVHIEDVHEETQTHVDSLRSKAADLGIIKSNVMMSRLAMSDKVRLTKEIQKIIDAIRYSDPVTPPNLNSFDELIVNQIYELQHSLEKESVSTIAERCANLLIIVKQRCEQIKTQKKSR